MRRSDTESNMLTLGLAGLLCKQAGHTGDCAEDKAMEQTMELAKKEGWQKCPSCGRMVELNTGCNHMT